MLIGCGQWSITLGRLDVMFAIQTMARFSAVPKEGHLARMLRVFGYLKGYLRYGIIIDTSEKQVQEVEDIEVNWNEQYPGATEELPKDMPIPNGKEVKITTYVDADHAHDLVTRCSVTGIFLFINNTPVKWYSKRQNISDLSSFVGLSLAGTKNLLEPKYSWNARGQ